ncbi:TPA: DNA polymerase III subunit delta [bacterium]|nr:DNA polymerase III subunit delta [bacterium]
MNKGEFLAQVKRGEISSLYLFLGEGYEQEETLKALRESLFQDERLLDFNFDLLYGDETQALLITDLANTFPLKAKRRIVVVKRIDQLPKKEVKDLAAYLYQGVPSSTCLIFCSENLPKNDPLYKIISKVGKVVNFWPPFDEDLPSFIILQAKKMNKEMEIGAAKALIEIKGKNLDELLKEIEKVVLYVGESPSITLEDALVVGSGESPQSIFDLLEAIVEGKTSVALFRLNSLIFGGEPPLKILFMIIKELHLVYQMKFLLEESKTQEEISSSLGITSRKSLSRLMRAVKFFEWEDIEGNLRSLLEADIALKSQEKRLHPLILGLLIMRLSGHSRKIC